MVFAIVVPTRRGLSHDDLLALVDALWAAPVHERRMAAGEGSARSMT